MGMIKHYYIYKGYWWYYPCTENKVFHKAQGLIIKSYTEEEFKRYYKDSIFVWEKVEEVKSGNND